MKYQVAIIQYHPKDGELEFNHHKASTYIRQAAAAGAQLAVLPEYHLGDFEPREDPALLQRYASWKKYLDRYCALAKELNICIVPGSLAVLHDNGSVTNSAFFIDNQGNICGKYEKKNLWHPERPFVKSSGNDSRHEAIDTPLGKVGLLICWDLAFPEAFRELIQQGVKLVIVPAYWRYGDACEQGLRRNPVSEGVFLDACVVSRAFENTCAVVFCNIANATHENPAGHSQVALPFQGCIGKCELNAEQMKIVSLDMAVVDEAEQVYKVREDMARDGWHYGYK